LPKECFDGMSEGCVDDNKDEAGLSGMTSRERVRRGVTGKGGFFFFRNLECTFPGREPLYEGCVEEERNMRMDNCEEGYFE